MPDDDKDFEREMLVREAEWTWSEMQDFNRLVQRYRYLYIAALVAGLGWALNRSLDTGAGMSALLKIGDRPDVAGILCIVPLITAVFSLLTTEATRKVQILARYRFLLAVKLGGKQPIWRWELFRRSGEEGSVRAWENPTNILLGGLTLVVSLTCYALSWNTVIKNPTLWWIAGPSVLFFVGSLYALAVVGLRGIHENGVADPPTTTYDGLRLRDKGKR